jgi:hypothetical protein
VRAWPVALVVVAVVSFGAGHATAHTGIGAPKAQKPAQADVPRAAPSHRARAKVRPRVTMIGDSVADEISYLSSAQAALGRGIQLNLELAACRRLVEASCTVAGVQPPTVLELVTSLGHSLGPDVVIAVGYNDYELLYPGDVLQVLKALRRAGVQHVLWLTLRAARHDYVDMNQTLREIASTDAQLTLVDWNAYSRSHPGWFDSDGVHLSPAGGDAMAALVHERLVAMGIAVR